MAVLEACTVIKKRLQPYKEANPSGTCFGSFKRGINCYVDEGLTECLQVLWAKVLM
jgi:hypothetical protein